MALTPQKEPTAEHGCDSYLETLWTLVIANVMAREVQVHFMRARLRHNLDDCAFFLTRQLVVPALEAREVKLSKDSQEQE